MKHFTVSNILLVIVLCGLGYTAQVNANFQNLDPCTAVHTLSQSELETCREKLKSEKESNNRIILELQEKNEIVEIKLRIINRLISGFPKAQ